VVLGVLEAAVAAVMKQAPLRERRLANRGMRKRFRVDQSRATFRKRPRDRWRGFVKAESAELMRVFVARVTADWVLN